MQSRNSKNLKGIDISMHQPNINLDSIKSKKYDIVIIKATEGVDYIDPKFERHYNEAKNADLKIGFYHFMSDKTNPKEQAHDFWECIKNKKFDVIPILDIERDRNGRSRTQITDRCIEFLNEFKRLSGYECIVYTYTSFANNSMDNRLSKYKCWIADYGKNDGSKQTPGTNRIWNRWVGFQYTSNGENGIYNNKPLDINEFTKDIFINNNSNSSSNSSNNSNKIKYGVVTGNNVRVRKGPGTNFKILGEVNKGYKIKLDKKLGDWWSIYYGEHGGFISSKYINVLETKYRILCYGMTSENRAKEGCSLLREKGSFNCNYESYKDHGTIKYRILCYGMTVEDRAKEACYILRSHGNFNCNYESYID